MADKLNRSTVYIAVLFVFSILCGEVHQLFSGNFNDVSTWFVIPLDFKITLPWYVHDIGMCVRHIIWALIGLKLAGNAGFRVRGIVFTWLGYCVADLILYLWHYQTEGYEVLLFLTGGALSAVLMIKK